jgi:prolyl-tRNA synthetase
VRVELDDRVEVSFGRRATNWELKGVPVRLELGPRDLADGVVTVVRRISGSKEPVALDGIADAVRTALDEQQAELLAAATAAREARTADVTTIDEAVEAAATGWARIPWSAVGEEGEHVLGQQSITVRCLRRPDGSLPATAEEPDLVAIVARSY